MLIRGTVSRRVSICTGMVLAAALFWPAAGDSANAGEVRTLSIYNIHTKETAHITFKRDGRFDDAGLKKINTFMRDWRRSEEIKMDPELIDLVWAIHRELGSKQPVHLISGYRSPATNSSLRKTRGGQAKRSQHILGKAADISFPDIPVKQLRNSALVREVGGVGYYPTSGIPFVHVDTGKVRSWPRVPRLELAALFPTGRSQHLPTDGKPITPRDYKTALAKGLVKDKSRTMIASAEPRSERSPAPAVQMPAVEMPNPAVPKPILASFAPPQAATPQPALLGAPASKSGAKPFVFASAGGERPAPALKLKAAAFPLYEDASVVSAPEVDDDHPDELSYVPFDTADLMTDTSVTYSRDIAALTHPDQHSLNYLFDDMEKPTALTFRISSGYTGLASVQRFSGQAVKSLYAEAPQPTRVASKR